MAMETKATNAGLVDALAENKAFDQANDAVQQKILEYNSTAHAYYRQYGIKENKLNVTDAREWAMRTIDRSTRDAADFAKQTVGSDVVVKNADGTYATRKITGAEMEDGRYKVTFENPAQGGQAFEYYSPLQLEDLRHKQSYYTRDFAKQKNVTAPAAVPSTTKTIRGAAPVAPTVPTTGRTVRGVGPIAAAAGAAAAAVGLGGGGAAAATVKTTGQITTKTSATVTAPAGGGGGAGGEISVTGKREEKIESQVKTTIEQPATQAPAGGAGVMKVEGTAKTTAQAKPGAAPAGQAMPSGIKIQSQTSLQAPAGAAPPTAARPAGVNIQVKQQARQGFEHAPPSPEAIKATRPMRVTRAPTTEKGRAIARDLAPFLAAPLSDDPQLIQQRMDEAATKWNELANYMDANPDVADDLEGQYAELGRAHGTAQKKLNQITGGTPPAESALSPTAPPGSVQRMPAPRPGKRVTGGAAPSAISRPVAITTGARPGPQISRPLGAAMSLGATQQRARATAPSGGLSGDTKPMDVTEDIMSDKPRAASMQTPGIYSPLDSRGAYSMGARAPGSIATEVEEDELISKGGTMATDQEGRAEALDAAKQQQRAMQANMPGAIPLGAGALAVGAAIGAPSEEIPVEEGEEIEDEEELTDEDIIEEDEAEDANVRQDQVQRAMQIEAMQAQQRQQIMAQGAQAGVMDSIEGAKKVQKNLQNIWRVVNAAEILDAEFILPLALWFLTANIQLLNKYTFKNKLIPPASLPEDALTCCIDCFVGSMMCMSFLMQMIIVALIILPYAFVGATIVAAGYLIGDWAGLTDKFGQFLTNTVAK